MDAEAFVLAVRRSVRDSAISDAVRVISKPPGRRPAEDLLELSAWYGSLDDKGRAMLARAIASAVDLAVFGFLCVLDGVRVIEDGGSGDRFRLVYQDPEPCWLNDPSGPMLHYMYNVQE